MKHRRRKLILPMRNSQMISLLTAFILLSSPFASADEKLDPLLISKLAGVSGTLDPDSGSFTVKMARTNLKTKISGMDIPTEFGLQLRVAISGVKDRAFLLGDIPLHESEVNQVIHLVLKAGLSVTSLHNRFLQDSNRIMSMHLEGNGTEEVLAKELGKVLEALAEKAPPPENTKKSSLNLSKSGLNSDAMEKLLWKGESSNGFYRVHLGRATTLDGEILGAGAGVDSWAIFAGSEKEAVTNGDIATIEFELPYVLEDLINAGIQITSIHTHMIKEKPRIIFVHFWGQGKLKPLAAGVKAAVWEKEHFQSQ
jgi:hypothetical protein